MSAPGPRTLTLRMTTGTCGGSTARRSSPTPTSQGSYIVPRSCLHPFCHAFCSLNKRIFFFSQSMHASPLCARTSLTGYSCCKLSIQLLLDLGWICVGPVTVWTESDYLKYLEFRNTFALFWLEEFMVFNRFMLSWLASSNINKGDLYMLLIFCCDFLLKCRVFR